jgi:hypothetical protein
LDALGNINPRLVSWIGGLGKYVPYTSLFGLDRVEISYFVINDIVLAVYENIGYDGLPLSCLEVTKSKVTLIGFNSF